MTDPSWSVVCTADEPLPLLAAFALHHLGLGASEVFLYLDNPRPGHVEKLRQIEGLHAIAHHAPPGHHRARSVEKRQLKNAHDAYHRTTADWICHIDSDEFLTPSGDRTIAALLADHPAEVDCLAVPMRERVYLSGQPVGRLFEGATIAPFGLRRTIRHPTPALAHRRAYGALGLLGHAMGKSFLRTGQPLIVGIHRPRPAKDHPQRHLAREAVRIHRTQAMHLVHYDGVTPFHWVSKLWRMAETMPADSLLRQNEGRRALIRQARSTLPEVAPIRALERSLRHLDPESIAQLRKARALHDLPHDPADAVAAHGLLPSAAVTPEAFDREMVEMYPGLAPIHDAWRALETTQPAD